MSIQRGQVHGFLGPNGSGKTTTIRLMCGLMEPSAGEVTVLGMRVADAAAEVRRHVGYMTQRFSLYEDMTLRENLNFLGRVHGLSRRRRRDRIDAVIEQCNLVPLVDKRVGPMSGGQKRRIALSAAILTEPELLILDEPTSEVDPNTRRQMWEQFFNLAQAGTTLLVSTHLMDEAERCHRLTIMNAGRVVADGSVDELKAGLPAQTYIVRAPAVTPLTPVIAAVPGVVSVNQVGVVLRVLTTDTAVRSAIESVLPAEAQVHETDPAIEDVFVHATQSEQRA